MRGFQIAAEHITSSILFPITFIVFINSSLQMAAERILEVPMLDCPVCGKQFATRHNLGQHWRVHSGERPHGIRICIKRVRVRHETCSTICGKHVQAILDQKNLTGLAGGVREGQNRSKYCPE